MADHAKIKAGSTWRHKKRGAVYRVIDGSAQVQAPEGSGLTDYEVVVVYQSNDGETWVRRISEFLDGRFEKLSEPPSEEWLMRMAGSTAPAPSWRLPMVEKKHTDAWDRILADDSLAMARRQLSIRSIRTIIKHVEAAMWRPIETLEGGDLDFVLARTADGRVMQWRASMLAHNLKGPTPSHLSFPAIEWMPAPMKDPRPLSGSKPHD